MYEVEPETTKAIVLIRDYRAVVQSKMKRGQTLENAAAGWRQRMVEIDALTRDLPAGSVHHVKFEAFCNDQEQELKAICRFLGVEFSRSMLERPAENVHHIGGSPSKFDPERRVISLDRSYERAFDPTSLDRLREIVGKVAIKWGY